MDTVSNSEQLNSDRAADTKTSSSISILRGGYLKATAFVAAFAAAYVVPAFGLLRGPGPTYEEGIVLFGADLVARGQVVALLEGEAVHALCREEDTIA